MIKLYRSLVLIVVSFFSVPIFLYFHLPSWFDILINTNLFTGVVTFLVGIVAMILYFQQKNDFKGDTASIILMEIRQAEESIEKLKVLPENNLNSSIILLPTNNWNEYKYLFIKDLDQDELGLVNHFYSECSQIDKAVSQLNISSQLEQKANHIHQTIVNLAKEVSDIEGGNLELTENDLHKKFKDKKDKFIKIISRDGFRFVPTLPIQEALIGLNAIEKVTVTSAGSKLKKIAQL